MVRLTQSMPIGFAVSDDGVLQRAYRSYSEASGAVQTLAAQKVELLRQYDVPGMNRAAAICYWGRSGTLLLASYLDNHPDIVMLPVLTSAPIYPFIEEYESLSIWEKLIAYPEYSGLMRINEGEFAVTAAPVAAAEYYAAVQALFALYGNEPAAWLNTRQRFFQFVHVAYAVGMGRQSDNPRPLMVYSQHYVNQDHAERFIEDFPNGQFIHTVRDPISGVDTWFDRQTQMELNDRGRRSDLSSRFLDPAVATMSVLLTWDCAHHGMGTRSRAIRFEDMHLAPKATMDRLANWLGIPYHPCLIESTWNGTPYVVDIRGVRCCGATPANAMRRSKNLPLKDRLLVFALFHENFVTWNYPSPSAMRKRWIRLSTIALFWLLPMKMELSTAKLIMQGQALPSLRRGRVAFALRAPFFLLKRRLRMMSLITAQAHSRLSGYERLLKPL
jgi:Sulfotransferase family